MAGSSDRYWTLTSASPGPGSPAGSVTNSKSLRLTMPTGRAVNLNWRFWRVLICNLRLQQTVCARELQRFDGCAARARGIAVGHDVDRDIRLFLALRRHARVNLGGEPALELLARFDGASADHQGIGVEGVDHFVEEYAQRMRLHAEDLLAHGIAFLRKAAHQLGRLVEVARSEEHTSELQSLRHLACR